MVLAAAASPDPELWLTDLLAKKVKVMGFGHRIYTVVDHRSTIIKEWARRVSYARGARAGPRLFDVAETVERVMAERKKLFSNLDYYMSIANYQCGFERSFPLVVFAVARCFGWCAHIAEQQQNNKLIRPNSLYTGPVFSTVPPPSLYARL